MGLGGALLFLAQGSCVVLIIILVVLAIVLFWASRQPVESWAFHPDTFTTSIAADERERPASMFTCGVLVSIVAAVFLLVGVVIF